MKASGTVICVNPDEKTVSGLFLKIGQALKAVLLKVVGPDKFNPDLLKVSPAPDGHGDFSFGCFQAAKMLGLNPAVLAQRLQEELSVCQNEFLISTKAVGPYVNFTLNRAKISGEIIGNVSRMGKAYGHNQSLVSRTILVEFLSPNTNKPLHIGHLRNGIIGTTVANLLSASGANVIRANNINDRGIHIVQSMLAYRLWGNGETPELTGEKGDHFVGRYYVKFHQAVAADFASWAKGNNIELADLSSEQKDELKAEHKKVCQLIATSREMLTAWENGDPEIMALWKTMNQWVYDGFDKTNARIGFIFDKVYFESQTYQLGRSIIQDQLQKGVCQQATDQSVTINLSDVGLGEKPISLLRKDGTSLYITQDIGLAVTRFKEIAGLSGSIYVVAREQEFHFKVLFEILRRYGYAWWNNLYHLSYGMVNLPSGKMKSREGTVVDADELMDQLRELVLGVIRKNDSTSSDEEAKNQAEIIAIGALKYMLALVAPNRDILFDPAKSVSFEGNTGPYLQYACVRIAGIEEKAEGIKERLDESSVITDAEFNLVKTIGLFPEFVRHSATAYDPSVMTSGLHEIAQAFSAFYSECPVVYNGRVNEFRLDLCRATRQVISNGLALLGIAIPNRM